MTTGLLVAAGLLITPKKVCDILDTIIFLERCIKSFIKPKVKQYLAYLIGITNGF